MKDVTLKAVLVATSKLIVDPFDEKKGFVKVLYEFSSIIN